jgi:signal transduction histidine kinase
MKDEVLKKVEDPSKEEKSQQELEKRVFHLKTLYDLTQEIGYLRETHEITRKLLLMMIGNFGASCGFIFLFDTSRGKMDTYSQRGLPKESVDIFSEKIESGDLTWLNKITQIETLDESNTARIKGREELIDLLSSLSLRIWVPFNIDSNLRGSIGLGDKLSGDPYSSDDQELLVTMAHQGAVAIENTKLQQARIEMLEQSKKDIEKLSKAKSRALDHLSHELRTPLSVIQGNIRILKRKTQAQTPPLVREEVFESLEKNLARLSDIQQETDQIIRSYQELETGSKIEKINTREVISVEPIILYPFTERILDKVRQKSAHRDLQIQFDGTHDLRLNMDPEVLEELLVGLLKNAIENTPDEGLIRVVLEQKDQWIQLKVMDFGIGITKENQRRLFDGLFHTLDTELYTSKKPYDFGAGGKGLDLLRVKVYSQRFGFDISVASQCCLYLPTDHDLCPGKISECPHCKVREDCLNSGGSTFCLTFIVTGK